MMVNAEDLKVGDMVTAKLVNSSGHCADKYVGRVVFVRKTNVGTVVMIEDMQGFEHPCLIGLWDIWKM